MFATHEGAVAAPTAGLHFTPELLGALAQAGVETARVTLHVGAGTFLPVRDRECAGASDACGARLYFRRDGGARSARRGRRAGGSCRSAPRRCGCSKPRRRGGEVEAFDGETDIFIIPGYRFKVADLLVTNFHLPRSTLLMLVRPLPGWSAFARPMRMRSRRVTGFIPMAMPVCWSVREFFV